MVLGVGCVLSPCRPAGSSSLWGCAVWVILGVQAAGEARGGLRGLFSLTDGLVSLPRPGPNRHEPGGRDPPQHFGGPPPLISPKPQLHAAPTALWNPVSLMDNTLETRRPESHPLHSHPAAFEPSRQAAVPLVKVERVFCPEKAEEGPRKREPAPVDKYQPPPPPPREGGTLEHQTFPPGPGPFLAELEKSTQTILGQQRASLPQAATFGELSGPLKPGSPYRSPVPRGPDPAYIYDEFLQQRRRLVSKLDLEERRRREAQEKGLPPRGPQPAHGEPHNGEGEPVCQPPAPPAFHVR
ncbi:Genetic suppressor element 1 [Saguinus oedipus]|uniref:Genetic suppressor element 1 n=1 Tax=Saguinus oedipus TaxID=9490 RepID=A0ABQ9TLY8_SAGOE|nr:Genetic suppressor element 1 [Saguinus oedipus]